MSKVLKTLYTSSLIIFLFSNFLITSFAAHLPAPSGFVNDFAGVIKQNEKTELENLLTDFEKQTTNEIAIATVKNMNGDYIENFAVKAFEEWKVGKDGKDNGILILVAVEERKVRIEVGYGLEGDITDARAGDIIRQEITPEFRNGNYGAGLKNAVNALIYKIDANFAQGKNIPEPVSNPGFQIKNPSDLANLVICGLFLIFSVGSYLFAYMARSKSIWLGGIMGGALAGVIAFVLQSLLFAIFFVPMAMILGFLLDFILSRSYSALRKTGKKTDFWHSYGGFSGFGTGGTIFGGGNSGGGFGGFGGGSSGGGGASGSW